MAKIVILGAGLTGLSTAYHLEKNNIFDFKIFEKETTHGGLCRSVAHDGFTFDFTGHLLHVNDGYFQAMLDMLLPEEKRNSIERKSFVFSNNRFVPYPFQMNLRGLPTEVITECLCGFARRNHQQDPQNFYEWVLKFFGAGIGKHFFFPYQSKLLQCSLKKIHPSWTGRFVPQTTMGDLLAGLGGKKSRVGYNHSFYYPKQGGIQAFTDSLRNQIASPVETKYNAVQIDLKQKVVFFENGHIEPFETLVTTIPLPILLQRLTQTSSLNVKGCHGRLRANAVVNFNLGFSPKQFIDKHWFYVPEKKYNFYRVGFWHNFSENLSKKNCGALYGELAYLPEQTDRAERDRLTEQSIEQACSMLGLTSGQIVARKILHIPYAYVRYDHWREHNLAALHRTLKKHAIHSVGRYGAWNYSSMQEAVLDGQQVVAELLRKKSKFTPAEKYVEYHKIQHPPSKEEKQAKQKQVQGE